MNFKQWLEGGGGFIYGSMADPATDQNDHPPLGSELTADPNMSLGGDDLPPTKKIEKKKDANLGLCLSGSGKKFH